MMRPQRVRPKPTKTGDQMILTAFALRFLVGLGAFIWITVAAFQAEPHFAWLVLLIALAYTGVAGTFLVKGLIGFRQRYGAEKEKKK
jgi:apolipoprotein N-acyltransferase